VHAARVTGHHDWRARWYARIPEPPNRAMAETGVRSPGTVKVHTRNLYGKLGVSNRTQAVMHARDRGRI